MMNFNKQLQQLCSPAYVYFLISFVTLVGIIIENLIYGDNTTYCVGSYKCDVPSTLMIFVFKVLYVVFWTIVLDALCKYGLTNLSWFLVIFPFVLMAVLIGLLMLNFNGKKM